MVQSKGSVDVMSEHNCAINERTADGVSVGRCYFYVGSEDECPRHGNVEWVMKRYRETGKLTDEKEFMKQKRRR